MPCRYDDYDYPAKGMVNREAHDLVTRAACTLAKAVEQLIENEVSDFDWEQDALVYAKDNGYIDAEAYSWVLSHRKMDEARKEKLKETALSKLTVEEKEALGL